MKIPSWLRAEHIFTVAWRVAILALPWQTRWFQDAQLLGWPWEEGRASVYLSWIPIVLTIIVGRAVGKRSLSKKTGMYVGVGFSLIFLATLFSLFSHGALPWPVLQMWIQWSLLSVFALTLWQAKIPSRTLSTWMLFSILPHVGLTFIQMGLQAVFGSSLFGMASQNPAQPGVSVIETLSLRFLRAYGGFPHPNILGGWSACMAMVACWNAGLATRRRETAFWITCIILSIITLIFSFSRGAWIAAAAGLITLFFVSFRATSAYRFVWAAVIGTACLMSLLVHPLIFARFTPTLRLEARSVNERTEVLKQGIQDLRSVPLMIVGTGPGMYLYVRAAMSDLSYTSAPLQPPHVVFVLALLEIGLLGMTGLLLLGWSIFQLRSRLRLPVGLFLLLLSLTDHYLWSYWPGQSLAMLCVLFVVLTADD